MVFPLKSEGTQGICQESHLKNRQEHVPNPVREARDYWPKGGGEGAQWCVHLIAYKYMLLSVCETGYMDDLCVVCKKSYGSLYVFGVGGTGVREYTAGT